MIFYHRGPAHTNTDSFFFFLPYRLSIFSPFGSSTLKGCSGQERLKYTIDDVHIMCCDVLAIHTRTTGACKLLHSVMRVNQQFRVLCGQKDKLLSQINISGFVCSVRLNYRRWNFNSGNRPFTRFLPFRVKLRFFLKTGWLFKLHTNAASLVLKPSSFSPIHIFSKPFCFLAKDWQLRLGREAFQCWSPVNLRASWAVFAWKFPDLWG